MSTGLEDAEFYGESMDQQAREKQAERDMQAFLRKLSKLARQTGVHIGGCGCHGSPFLSLAKGKVLAEGLHYNAEAEKYITE